MKIIKYIIAFPAAVLISILSSFIFAFLVKISKYIVPSIFAWGDWIPKFMPGLIFVTAASVIPEKYNKTFAVIALVLAIIIFIINVKVYNTYETAFLIGCIAGAVNSFISPLKFKES